MAFAWTPLPHSVLSDIGPTLLSVSIFLLLYILHKKRASLPPGPQPWPIIGNALDMPKEKAWLRYTEWMKTYGDIVFLSIFNRKIVILNSPQAAKDLLHKRSSIYSDRPYMAMGGDLVGWDHGLSLTPYGEQLRLRRRLIHQVLNPRSVQVFWPAVELQTAKFLNRLLESPDLLVDHIRHMVAATVLKISHGYTVLEAEKDPFVALAETALGQFSLSTAPGAFLVDVLPWLMYVPSWMPGAGFLRTAAAWRKNLFFTADAVHSYAKREIAKGTAVRSFASEHLSAPHTPETEFAVKWTAFSIYGGGADTTVSAMSTFFLAMCTHPEVQAAGKAEIDRVIGNERLPTIEDRDNLPYIGAIVKEVMRWGPVLPAGIPHRLMKEDNYLGQRIPAGSIVISNIWGMTHDPEAFPEPSEFRPDRFMKSDNPPAAFDPAQLIFGFGRRICPGRHLAEPTLFLSVAMTLATFNISKALDESGKIIEPVRDWLPGTISHPRPFRCEIKPRFPTTVDLITHAIAPRQS
ncbi:cytochrome P450 [Ramaria rubella]|nr:cytochrome P450 [Ramaria rubella]